MKPDNQPSEIKYIRGKLCEHCCEFILRYEPLIRDRQILDIKLSDTYFVRGSPPVRAMNAVKVGAEAGCWICNHLTSNALRDQNGDIYPFRASVYSYTVGDPGFTVDLFETKKRVIYRERFRLSSSKQITDSTPEGSQMAALKDAFVSQLSQQGNGSVKAPKNAYTQGSAIKRKLSRTSEGMLVVLQWKTSLRSVQIIHEISVVNHFQRQQAFRHGRLVVHRKQKSGSKSAMRSTQNVAQHARCFVLLSIPCA